MSTVYVLMQGHFEYGDDYHYPAGQEPHKVYTTKEAAQEQCAEMNAQAWADVKVTDYWGYDIYTSEEEMRDIADGELHDDGCFYPEDWKRSLTLFSAEETRELMGSYFPEAWESYRLRRAVGQNDTENPFEQSESHGEEYDAELLASQEAAPEDAFAEAEFSDESEQASKSSHPAYYTLATLHGKLTEILGTKMGAPWTEKQQWYTWRVPSVTLDEAAALSRFFGITFYQVVEVEMES